MAKTEEEVSVCLAYAEAMRKAGMLVGGERLQSAWNATTVRLAAGRVEVLDGPYTRRRAATLAYDKQGEYVPLADQDPAEWDNAMPFWASRANRADLLARADDVSAAREAYARAIGLEVDPQIRCFLVRRRTELTERGDPQR